MRKLAAFAIRIFALLFFASIGLLAGFRPAVSATGDLVSFASNAEINFPLKPGGLDVAPVRFPFFVTSGVIPGDLDVAVIKVTKDKQGIDPPLFTAKIIPAEGANDLYSVEIAAAATTGSTQGNHAAGDHARAEESAARNAAAHPLEIAAGKYDISVILWSKTPPAPGQPAVSQPIAVTNGTINCAVCQPRTFTITREAATLDVSITSIAAPIWDLKREFWDKSPDAGITTLIETGGKSSARIAGLTAFANRPDGLTATLGATLIDQETAETTAVIERSGTRTLSLDASRLAPGTWTTTIRLKSDQLGGDSNFVKVVTIVRKLSAWLLFIAIVAGIAGGWVVRTLLQRRQDQAAANALAADLRTYLGTLQDIEDEPFALARKAVWGELDAAISAGRSSEEITTLAASLTTKIDTALEAYRVRQQTELGQLTLLEDAASDLSREAPGLAPDLKDLLSEVRRRLQLAKTTRVSDSAKGEPRTEDLLQAAIEKVSVWMTGFGQALTDLRAAWPTPPRVQTSLDPLVTAVAGLGSGVPPTARDKRLELMIGAASLALRFRTTLDRLWLPEVKRQARTMRAAAADQNAVPAFDSAVLDLEREAGVASAEGAPTLDLVTATDKAWSAAPAATPAATLQPGAAAMGDAGDGDTGNGAQSRSTMSLALVGPSLVMANVDSTWTIETDPSARIQWLIDGEIASIGGRTLTRRFVEPGGYTISVQIDGEHPTKADLRVSVTQNPALKTGAIWRKQRRWYEDLAQFGLGAVIALSGLGILQASFFGWWDLLTGFIWGFGADITVAVAATARTDLLSRR